MSRPDERRDAEPAAPAPSGFGFDAEGRDVWLDELRAAVHASGDVDLATGPRMLGAYRIEAVLGRGGQGVVYRARLGDRVVALKCLAGGRGADPEALARFERELRLAASLEHPGIVAVRGMELLDGRPALTMEWVQGEPITAWARPPGGGPRSIAEVVAAVRALCEAMRHAHQRGVLHRDLKPSNVLVGADGQPKVLDFGIARELLDDAVEGLTASGEFLGTLAYAAPEQLDGRRRAPDVRTDVFAIGGILYEMLTGVRPHGSPPDLRAALRALTRDAAPPRPSRVRPEVGYELDAIVLQALAPDPGARYQSVDAMLEDLRRLVAGEPVQAHPPSSWYELRKFVGRYRLPVLSMALAVAAVVAFAIVAQWQARAILRAEAEAATARAASAGIVDFVHALFLDLSPRHRGEPATIEGLIERATERIDRHFPAGSAARADLRETIGSLLTERGQHPAAIGVLEDAVRLRVANGDAPLAVARCRVRLAVALREFSEYPRARAAIDAAIGPLRSAGEEVARDDLATALGELAALESVAGQHTRARELTAEVLGIWERAGADAALRSADVFETLARLHDLGGDYAAARAAAARALELRTVNLGPRHPDVAAAWQTLGDASESTGDLDQAEQAFATAVQIYTELLGDRHPRTAMARLQLGELAWLQGRIEEADATFGEVLDILVAVGHDDAERFASALASRAATQMLLAGPDAAVGMLRASLAVMTRHRSGPQLGIAAVQANLAAVLAQRGYAALDRARPEPNADLTEARELLRSSRAAREAILGPQHGLLAQDSNGLGAIASYLHAWEEARADYEDARSRLESGFPDGHPFLVTVLTNLAALARDEARAAARHGAPLDLRAADAAFRAAVAAADQAGLPPMHRDRTFLLQQHAIVLAEAGHVDAARAQLVKIADADDGAVADGEGFIDDAHLRLAVALYEAGELDAAAARIAFLCAKLDRHAGNSARTPEQALTMALRIAERRGDAESVERLRARLRQGEVR